MVEKFSPEQIRDFWQKQALDHGQSSNASWSDRMVIEMEIREILKRLRDGDRVLDAGCANGYSTVQFASQRKIRIHGIDFIPEMIEQARTRLATLQDKLQGSVEFQVGDITSLDLPAESFDRVICIRVLINLRDLDRQQLGLRECSRVLKPGGMLLLSEATLQGWSRLNQFRREWNLPEILMPSFNEYLDEQKVSEAAGSEMELQELVNFSSTYYVATRVLKPLLIQALGANIDAADPNMEWNRFFAQLPAWGDYGTQKLFVFKKR